LHYVYHDQVVENLETIGRTCREAGTHAVFLAHPWFGSEKTMDEYAARELHQDLNDLAAQAGLLPLDLLEAYGDFAPEELLLPDDLCHPNARGHQLIADFLYEELLQRELLPEPARAEGGG
jgi:lysophospholipase L1-like esterase